MPALEQIAGRAETPVRKDSVLQMNDLDVALFKSQCIDHIASMLGVEGDFLDIGRLRERIRLRDQDVFELMERCFEAYDQWYRFSKQMAADVEFNAANQSEFAGTM